MALQQLNDGLPVQSADSETSVHQYNLQMDGFKKLLCDVVSVDGLGPHDEV